MNKILRKAKEGGNLCDQVLSGQPDRLFNAPPGLAMPTHTDEEEQRIVRQVEQLRACAGNYRQFSEERVQRWLAWWEANYVRLDLRGSLPRQAYTLALLVFMGLDPRTVPVVYEDDKTIIWRSTNFCPTLEACRRLGLDIRIVCRAGHGRFDASADRPPRPAPGLLPRLRDRHPAVCELL